VCSRNVSDWATPRQRPPSAAAEDRNMSWRSTRRRPKRAAAAVRGGRGSQRLARPLAEHRSPPGSGRRPRRPRIATTEKPQGILTPLRQRPPSAAAEDRNPFHSNVTPTYVDGSGRRPRRPRIATPRSGCLRCRGDRRSGRRPRRPRIATHSSSSDFAAVAEAAAAVRGGRGSQHLAGRERVPTAGQRPPSAAAEDRNNDAASDASGRH